MADRTVQVRRDFLRGMGAASAAAVLAGCGFGFRSRNSGAARRIRMSNWPLYIDRTILDDFRKELGVTVDYTEDVNDNDEYFAKIREPLSRGRSIDRDIFVLSDSTAARVARLGWVRQIDKSAVPNWVNVTDQLRDSVYDPGRVHSLPWLAGMTGIAYDVARTGRDIKSVDDVFDKAFAGHVSMLTEMEDTLGLVLLGMDLDLRKVTFEDAQRGVERIRIARDSGQIRRFTGNDYADDLARGDVWVAFAWSGDVVQLARDNENLRFVIPDEGGILWSDDMLVPKSAANAEGAWSFMNFVYSPEVAARLVTEVEYVSPVKGVAEVLERTDPELANNPLINPPQDIRSRLREFRVLEEDEASRWTELFQSVVRS